MPRRNCADLDRTLPKREEPFSPLPTKAVSERFQAVNRLSIRLSSMLLFSFLNLPGSSEGGKGGKKRTSIRAVRGERHSEGRNELEELRGSAACGPPRRHERAARPPVPGRRDMPGTSRRAYPRLTHRRGLRRRRAPLSKSPAGFSRRATRAIWPGFQKEQPPALSLFLRMS